MFWVLDLGRWWISCAILIGSASFTPAGAGDKNITEANEEVLDLICKGYANKEIADRLSLSVETVRTHLKRIYENLHVRCRTEAAMKYREGRERSGGTPGNQLP